MTLPDHEIVVLEIAGHRAWVACRESTAESRLRNIGFTQVGERWERSLTDDADRTAVVLSLLEMSALFSAGQGWSPEELLALYRDEGIVTGPFRVIAWRSPTDFAIITR